MRLSAALVVASERCRRAESEGEDRQRFLEPFAHALGGTRILGLEPAREVE